MRRIRLPYESLEEWLWATPKSERRHHCSLSKGFDRPEVTKGGNSKGALSAQPHHQPRFDGHHVNPIARAPPLEACGSETSLQFGKACQLPSQLRAARPAGSASTALGRERPPAGGNELQRLHLARAPPAEDGRGWAARLRHRYDASDQRVIKRVVATTQRHTLYVFGSLEVRRTTYASDTYSVTNASVVPYAMANGVRLARLHYSTAATSPQVTGTGAPALPYNTHTPATLHVLLELGDHLGSTGTVLDKLTSELVEQTAYLPFGARENDYRQVDGTTGSNRWTSFREDYGFTGKEEDVEVGLTYFGKRFLSPQLGRWVSPDPLAVHAAGRGDFNLYAYVTGAILKATDPMGLEIRLAGTSSGTDGTYMGMNVERQVGTIVKILQQLTNDKLKMTKNEDGTYSVQIEQAAKGRDSKPVGTSLVRGLIDNEKRTVTIGLDDPIGKSSDTIPANNTNAGNGIGADSRIRLSLNDTSHEFKVMDRKTGEIKFAPTRISVILGHELVHAEHHTTGTAVPHLTSPSLEAIQQHPEMYWEHTYRNEHGDMTTRLMEREESDTIGFSARAGQPTENQLRAEQGEDERVAQ
jgi:RHS repeat-associated protein